MDHHLTRYMFKLRSRQPGDEASTPPAAEKAANGLTPLEPLPGDEFAPADDPEQPEEGSGG
jgi:hypothetical protein